MLNKLIDDIKEHGIFGAAPLGFRGKPKPVLDFLSLMVDTDLYLPDKEQWSYLVDEAARDGGSVR